MSIITKGLGGRLITQGYGGALDITIVIRIDAPARYDRPTEPLVFFHQNTYDGIVLHLGADWVEYLASGTPSIKLTAKRYAVSTTPYFSVPGVFNVEQGTITFNLTVDETDILPIHDALHWEITAQKNSPDAFNEIIEGRLQVEPTLRRVR